MPDEIRYSRIQKKIRLNLFLKHVSAPLDLKLFPAFFVFVLGIARLAIQNGIFSTFHLIEHLHTEI